MGWSVSWYPCCAAWTLLKVKGIDAAAEALAPLGTVNGFEPLYELQLALLNDAAKRPAEARKHYDKAMDVASDATFPMVELVANFHLRQGDTKGAEALYAAFEKTHPRSLLTAPLRKQLAAGGKTQPIIATAADGMAEALFNLAVLLQGENSNDVALLMARLAVEGRPNDSLFTVLLADVLDAQVPQRGCARPLSQGAADSPYGWQAQIKIGEELHKLGRDDEAVAYLQKLVDSQTDRPEAAVELGDVLRADKRFAEAAKAYDTAIARLPKPGASDWSIFYFRGIAYERSDQWAKAELDFKKALELQPDQPYVLNYLGYTWVDRGVHLDEAIGMLQRAVEQKPDDGFIIDSLAWAYYRLKQYDKAVIYQEKADLAGAGRSGAERSSGRHLLEARPAQRGALPVAARACLQARCRSGEADRGEAAARPRCGWRLTAAGRAAGDRPVTAAALRLTARAKINLYLHVTGRRDDGYHLIDSLVCFAELGDELTIEPARELSLSLEGPFAPALAGSRQSRAARRRLLDAGPRC